MTDFQTLALSKRMIDEAPVKNCAVASVELHRLDICLRRIDHTGNPLKATVIIRRPVEVSGMARALPAFAVKGAERRRAGDVGRQNKREGANPCDQISF